MNCLHKIPGKKNLLIKFEESIWSISRNRGVTFLGFSAFSCNFHSSARFFLSFCFWEPSPLRSIVSFYFTRATRANEQENVAVICWNSRQILSHCSHGRGPGVLDLLTGVNRRENNTICRKEVCSRIYKLKKTRIWFSGK